MRRRFVVLLSSLSVLSTARAQDDTFDHIGRVAVVQRMHRVLDLYQWMRLASLDADTDWRFDVMTSGGLHAVTGIEPDHRLTMSRTGHVVGVDRLPYGLGVAFFRSSAYDEVYEHLLNDDGTDAELIDYAGWKATVMGGQVWWADTLSLAIGWIGEGGPTTSHADVRRPPPEVPRYEPAFVRLESPRFGAAARLDLLGADIGDAAFSLDDLSVLPWLRLGVAANRWALTDEVTTGLEVVTSIGRLTDVIGLVGMEWTAPELRYVVTGIRLGRQKRLAGGEVGAEWRFLVGAAKARRSPLGGPTAWQPTSGTALRGWVTVDWVSIGFDLSAGLADVDHPNPAPAPLSGTSTRFGGFLRIGI